MSADAFEPLLTYRQTAEVLGVTERTVRTLVSTNELPAVRFGGSVRVDPADLRRFIESSKRGTSMDQKRPSPTTSSARSAH